ncbi:MAG: tetratricopeptide repeat protein, partial [Phycisphaerales bacterium JB038]
MAKQRPGRPGRANKPKRLSVRDAAAEALGERARLALAEGDFDVAEKHLRDLLKTRPGDLAARGTLGRALLQQGKLEECEAQAAEILQRFPKSAEAVHAAAQLYDQVHNNDKAIEHARQAAEMAAEPAGILADLASALERVHRLEEAREAIERALELEPELPKARFTQALLLARAKDYDGAVERFGALFDAAGAPADVRISAGYELGRTLDRQGRYDEAMEALQRAKTLQRPGCLTAVQQAKVLDRQYAAMGAAVTAADLRQVEPEPLTSVGLMVGFTRTGSTLLESALDRHPELISAEETPALAIAIVRPLARQGPKGRAPIDLIRQMTPEQAHRCRQQYLQSLQRYMRTEIGARLVLDKNPAYTNAIPFV